jgi:tetratricopeptide (TPR) repeat protein
VRLLPIAAALLLSATPACADGLPPERLTAEESEGQLLLIEKALAAGRMVQTDAMLRWLEPRLVDGYRNRFNLLLAEYFLAREDAASAEAAIAPVDGALVDSCRFSGIWGWIAFQKRDWNRAIAMLANAVDACPGDPGRWNLLGQALTKRGEYAASIEAFDAALTAAPFQAAVLNNRALSLAYSGEMARAISDLEIAVAIAPENLAISDNLAFLRANAGLDMVKGPASDDARTLAMAGEGALAASRTGIATSYFTQAVLAYDRFDPGLWRKANGNFETGGE